MSNHLHGSSTIDGLGDVLAEQWLDDDLDDLDDPFDRYADLAENILEVLETGRPTTIDQLIELLIEDWAVDPSADPAELRWR